MLSSAVSESLEYFSNASVNSEELVSQLATASSQRVTQGDVPLYATASNQYDRLYGKLQHHVRQRAANCKVAETVEAQLTIFILFHHL